MRCGLEINGVHGCITAGFGSIVDEATAAIENACLNYEPPV